MTFHSLNQNGRERSKPLAAYPIRPFPGHDQCLAHRIIINPALRARIVPLASAATS
jgi:hypothetical protein